MYNIARNRNMKHGFFIIIDGPSASGKDSIIQQMLKDLGRIGIPAVTIEETKEKYYDRKKILSAKQYGDKTVAQTIINERKKLYQAKIVPQLLSNIVVIANRGEPSTTVYQTIKNEIAMEDVWKMHRKQEVLLPDLVVISNCSAKEAIRREDARKSSSEKEEKDFMSGKFTPPPSQKENIEKRKLIHANYKKLRDFLKKKGVPVIYLETEDMTILEGSQKIIGFVKETMYKF